VEDSELVYMVDAGWDFELVGRTLTIRHALRSIALKIEFAVPDAVFIHNGVFWKNGVCVKVHAGMLALENTGGAWDGCGFGNFNAGIVVGALPIGYRGCMRFTNVPRFKWQPAGIWALNSREDR